MLSGGHETSAASCLQRYFHLEVETEFITSSKMLIYRHESVRLPLLNVIPGKALQ